MAEKTITLTRDELIQKGSEALTMMVMKNPRLFILADELSAAIGTLAFVLFGPNEKKKPTLEEKRKVLFDLFGAVELSDEATNDLYDNYVKPKLKEE